ncbi:hypothetical protein [Sphingopyxis sp. GW247-27LB]|uniref:hypothetical protein n=1 Tax=Sphingopyxis sp. GW247-27LB TaxID=2012632 RepID=UPI001140B946|nr:hypothetical protein [Sphingopyxis sp. GW247-27LB]
MTFLVIEHALLAGFLSADPRSINWGVFVFFLIGGLALYWIYETAAPDKIDREIEKFLSQPKGTEK